MRADRVAPSCVTFAVCVALFGCESSTAIAEALPVEPAAAVSSSAPIEKQVASTSCGAQFACPGWTFALLAFAPEGLRRARDRLLLDIAEHASPAARFVSLLADDTQTQLVDINGGHAAIVEGFDNLDPTHPETLRAFGRYLAERHASAHNALIFWGHGRGWQGFGARGNGARGHGYSLANGQLSRGLEAFVDGLGRKLDIIGFDACLMGSWEVAASVAPFGSLFIASPDLVPESSWPLGRIAARLGDAPDVAPRELAQEISTHFETASRHNVALTTLDLEALPALDRALDNLAKDALREKCRFSSEWLKTTFSYREEGAFDLEMLAKSIERGGCTGHIRDRARSVSEALARVRVIRTCKGKHCAAGGLAVHATDTRMETSYLSPEAPWNQRAAWSRWLTASAADVSK